MFGDAAADKLLEYAAEKFEDFVKDASILQITPYSITLNVVFGSFSESRTVVASIGKNKMPLKSSLTIF